MLYEIVKSSISNDGNTCYYLYRCKAAAEELVCDTYGFSASTPLISSSIDDVITDSETAFELLDVISNKSVSVNGFKNFITQYVDKM